MNAPLHLRSLRFCTIAGLALLGLFTFIPRHSAQTAAISLSVAGFSSRLPVVIIDNAGAGALLKDSPDQTAELAVFIPDHGETRLTGRLPALSTALTISVRGASSAEFPKKSFNLTLRDRRGSKRAQPLLDLPASDKWALVAPWKFDPSYVNNALVYALSNRMGRWAPRTRFVEVFFNTRGGEVTLADYAGIYLLTERVEPGEQRVNVAKLSAADQSAPAITGGYIFKIDQAAADDVAWKTSRPLSSDDRASVVLVAPRAEDVIAAQQTYLRDYLLAMEKALASDEASAWTQRTSLEFIDRPSWVDHHLLNTFVCNPDAFVRSAYFTKDRAGKLVAGPVWDFDRALGSYWDERSFRWDVWSGVGAADVWKSGWWGSITRDPEFMQAWIDRWQALRTTELATSRLVQLAEGLASEVGAESAVRDSNRWPDNASSRGSYAGEINRLSDWLAQRAGWIDGQFVGQPERQIANGTITFAAPAGATLVYTIDGTDPRSVGGEVAPNAQFAAERLMLPAEANVHVRSYRVELRGVFPGSPWSSVVGSERASPLSPVSRISNFSTRGVIGVGSDALITGFVVADTTNKRYFSRAVGPGLAAFGTEGFVARPQLIMVGAENRELSRNAGWENGPSVSDFPALTKAVGAFPLVSGKPDAALVSNLGGGTHTVTATALDGFSGIGLVELYELDANGRTSSFATRGAVKRAGGSLVVGFVLQGIASHRVLLRAVGPTLGKLGVADALAKPMLTVYKGSVAVATNDRWSAEDSVLARATKSVGAFPLPPDSDDAALFLTLPPGAYSIEVKGQGDSEGVVLLELHQVP